jgi:hypothetical protein
MAEETGEYQPLWYVVWSQMPKELPPNPNTAPVSEQLYNYWALPFLANWQFFLFGLLILQATRAVGTKIILMMLPLKYHEHAGMIFNRVLSIVHAVFQVINTIRVFMDMPQSITVAGWVLGSSPSTWVGERVGLVG